MQKTKLGISVGLLGALTYFAGLFSGYQIAIIIMGYVLLFEENVWLRKTCVKAIVLMLTFSIAIYAIDLIPDVFSWISSCIGILNINISFSFIYSVANVITSAIGIIKILVFLLLGLKALSQGDIKIPVVDNLVEKHM